MNCKRDGELLLNHFFYPHDLCPAFSPPNIAGEQVDVAMTICAVELAQSTMAIVEEQRRATYCRKITCNDMRPACPVGATFEQADVALTICAVEFGQPTLAIVEE